MAFIRQLWIEIWFCTEFTSLVYHAVHFAHNELHDRARGLDNMSLTGLETCNTHQA